MTTKKPISTEQRREYNSARRAGQKLRDAAATWAKLYRDAQAAGGRLCLNPDDHPDDQSWLDGTDPELLISLLESLAETGSFDVEIDFRPMMAKLHVKALGLTKYDEKVDAVMKEFGIEDRRHAQRLLSKPKPLSK